MEKFRSNVFRLKGRKSRHQFHSAEMEQRSPDILIGIGKIRVERMITLSLLLTSHLSTEATALASSYK
jgi:hypothetical protein